VGQGADSLANRPRVVRKNTSPLGRTVTIERMESDTDPSAVTAARAAEALARTEREVDVCRLFASLDKTHARFDAICLPRCFDRRPGRASARGRDGRVFAKDDARPCSGAQFRLRATSHDANADPRG
jgi:hypothetical protein